MTITVAGFLMLLTSIPAKKMTASDVLDTYRLCWQVEIASKRLGHPQTLGEESPNLPEDGAHLITILMIVETVTDALAPPRCEDETSFRGFILVEAS